MTFTSFSVRSGPLNVGVESAGPETGWPVVLLHGFPYNPRVFEAVAAELAGALPTNLTSGQALPSGVDMTSTAPTTGEAHGTLLLSLSA